jgi:peptide/nickel transport system substrate-binding protein
MKKISRRQFLRISAVAGAGAVLAACGTPEPDETMVATEEPVAEATATPKPIPPTATPAPVDTPTPVPELVWPRVDVARNRTLALLWGSVHTVGINNPMNTNHQTGAASQMEALFYYGALDGKTYPWLAESYEYNDDATEMTLYLKKGIKWNDGEPFTAKDVAFTYNTQVKFAPLLPESAQLKNDLVEAEALDDHTVKFTLTNQNARFHFTNCTTRMDRGKKMLAEHVYNQFETGEEIKEFAEWDPDNGVYGTYTGPYLLVRTEEQFSEYHLRYEYWGVETGFVDRMPWPEAITTIIYASEELAGQLLINDEVDTALDMRPATIKAILDQAPDHITSYSGLNPPYGYVDWWPISMYPNNNEPPYDDVRVRQALAYAVDQQGVVDIGFGGAGEVSVAPFPKYPTLMKFLESPAMKAVLEEYDYLAHDLDKVDALMTDAGFEKNADGFWAKDGETFDCDIWAGVPLFGDIAPVTAEYLRQAGFPSNHVTPPDVWTGKGDGRAMLHFFGHGGSVWDPWTTLQMYLSEWWAPTGENCGQNRPRWQNEEYDGYINEMSLTSPDDEAKMQELFDKAMAIWYAECPEINMVEWHHRTPQNTTYWTGWPNNDDPYNTSFWHQTLPLTLHRLEPTT